MSGGGDPIGGGGGGSGIGSGIGSNIGPVDHAADHRKFIARLRINDLVDVSDLLGKDWRVYQVIGMEIDMIQVAPLVSGSERPTKPAEWIKKSSNRLDRPHSHTQTNKNIRPGVQPQQQTPATAPIQSNAPINPASQPTHPSSTPVNGGHASITAVSSVPNSGSSNSAHMNAAAIALTNLAVSQSQQQPGHASVAPSVAARDPSSSTVPPSSKDSGAVAAPVATPNPNPPQQQQQPGQSAPPLASAAPSSSQPSAPPTMTDSELKKFRSDIKVGDIVDFQSERHRQQWFAGEVTHVKSGFLTFGSGEIEVVNFNTNEREVIPKDSGRIWPPMTKSAQPATPTPAQQPPPSNNAQPVRATPANVHLPPIAGRPGNVAGSNNGSVPPTANILNLPAQSPPVASPGAGAQQPSSGVGGAVGEPAAPAVTPVVEGGVPVAPLGLNDPTLVSGHGWTLRQGDSIDCLDTEQKWRLAEIVNIDPTHVLVHYVHWSSKWDAWFAKSDKSLQPPRTKTDGYTGPANKRPVEEGSVVSSQPTAVHKPTVVQQPPQPPPRPSYTCLQACSWKRVLSTGLSHKEIQALNEIFAQCAYVQDSYEEVILGRNSTPSNAYSSGSIYSSVYGYYSPPQPVFKHTLTTVNALLTKLEGEIVTLQSTMLSPQCQFPLSQCAAIAANIRGLILDAEDTTRRQLLAAQEDEYMAKLNEKFRIVEIPSDGSCLFSAVGIGQQIIQAAQKVAAKTPQPRVTDGEEKEDQPSSSPTTVSPASPATSSKSDSDDSKLPGSGTHASDVDPLIVLTLLRQAIDPKLQQVVASRCRLDLITFLRDAIDPANPAVSDEDRQRWLAKITSEVKEVIQQESAGKYSDATSKAVWDELKSSSSGGAGGSPLSLAESRSAVDAYLKVMGLEGIYGTSLEVDALSEMFQTPIHLYYRTEAEQQQPQPDGSAASSSPANSSLAPGQIIGAHYPGPAICLAYYMGNKHYNLLVDRACIPTPPPKPAVPSYAAVSAASSQAQAKSSASAAPSSVLTSPTVPIEEGQIDETMMDVVPGGPAPVSDASLHHRSNSNSSVSSVTTVGITAATEGMSEISLAPPTTVTAPTPLSRASSLGEVKPTSIEDVHMTILASNTISGSHPSAPSTPKSLVSSSTSTHASATGLSASQGASSTIKPSSATNSPSLASMVGPPKASSSVSGQTQPASSYMSASTPPPTIQPVPHVGPIISRPTMPVPQTPSSTIGSTLPTTVLSSTIPEPTINLNIHFPGSKHKIPQPLFLNQQLISLINHPQLKVFNLTPEQQQQVKFFVSNGPDWDEVDPRQTPLQLKLENGTHVGIQLKK